MGTIPVSAALMTSGSCTSETVDPLLDDARGHAQHLDVPGDVPRDDRARSDHRAGADRPALEHDRPHADVHPGADSTRSGDVGTGLQRDEVADLRVGPDQYA